MSLKIKGVIVLFGLLSVTGRSVPLYFDSFLGVGFLSTASASYSLGSKLGVKPFENAWKTGVDLSIEIFHGGSLVHSLAFIEYQKKMNETSKRSVDIGLAVGPATARIANYPNTVFSTFAYISLNHDLDPVTQWLFLLKVGTVTGYFNVGFRVGFKFRL